MLSWLHSGVFCHKFSNFGQRYKAWVVSLVYKLHNWHKSLVTTWHLSKFILGGSEFLKARQNIFFTFPGTFKPQIFFHRGCKVVTSEEPGSLARHWLCRNLYPVWIVYSSFGLKGQIKTSSCINRQRGMSLMISASQSKHYNSISSLFHTRLVWSIKELAIVVLSLAIEGEMILLLNFPGSHLSPHIWTKFPLPIRQAALLLITSQPRRILFHAYKALRGSLASIILQFGKVFSLNTR